MLLTRYLPKMLFVVGLATVSCFIYAIAPEWAIMPILGLPYSETFAANYFDQGHYFFYHWGVIVGFMGVVMVVAAIEQHSLFPDPEIAFPSIVSDLKSQPQAILPDPEKTV